MFQKIKSKVGAFFTEVGKGVFSLLKAALEVLVARNKDLDNISTKISLADTHKALDILEAEVNEKKQAETTDKDAKHIGELEDKIDDKRKELDKKPGEKAEDLEKEWKE